MASVVITSAKNDIFCSTQTTPCGSFIYITYKLYQGGSLYSTFNTTAPSYSFNDVPLGFNYYVVIEIYNAGPTLCDSATSNTVTLTSYCIPSGANDLSFGKLKEFYDLYSYDVKLSGTNDPSTSGSIFGNSDLPNSGSPSKLRPNAVSELRNRCGGAVVWLDVKDYILNRIVSSNSMTLTTEVRDDSTNSVWGSQANSTSGCVVVYTSTSFIRSDLDYEFSATVTRSGSIVGSLYVEIVRLDNETSVHINSWTVNTSTSYTGTINGTLIANVSYYFLASFRESTCDPV